jgi:hypothetical protein
MSEDDDKALLKSLRKFIVSAHDPPPPAERIPEWRSIVGLALVALTFAFLSMLLEDSYSPLITALGKIAPFLFGASLVVLLEETRKKFAKACGRKGWFILIFVCSIIFGSLWWISVDKTKIPVRVSDGTTLLLGKDTIPFVSNGREIEMSRLRYETLIVKRSALSVAGQLDLIDSVEVGPWARIRSTGVLKFLFGPAPLDLRGTQFVVVQFLSPDNAARSVRVEGWFPTWFTTRDRAGYDWTRLKTRRFETEKKDSLSVVYSFSPENSGFRLPDGDYDLQVTDGRCKRRLPLRVHDPFQEVPADTSSCRGGL